MTKCNTIHKPVKTAKTKTPEIIFEYIRRRHAGRTIKVGVVIGVASDKKVNVSWSKCNLKKDKFDVGNGRTLAIDRARGVKKAPPAPLCIHTQLRKFGARCCRYFKGANSIILPS